MDAWMGGVAQLRARYLIRTQGADGSWSGQGKPTADTAFATLFLLRSTKKSIERTWTFGEGGLLVGRGLPPAPSQTRSGNPDRFQQGRIHPAAADDDVFPILEPTWANSYL